MPTGYTYEILENPDLTFQEFALRCSRAFGACIMMRDDDGKAIPSREKITISAEYHVKALEKALEKQEQYKDWHPEHPDFKAKVDEKYRSTIEHAFEQIEKINVQAQALKEMLTEVQAWNPPSSEHVNFKEFMVQQLEDTIKHDGSIEFYEKELERYNKPPDYQEQFAIEKEFIDHDIEYHKQHIKDIEEGNKERIKWTEILCNSLDIEFN